MYTVEQLNAFEDEIAEIYKTGVIKAPVHLRKGFGYAENMIRIFKKIQPQDVVFGYWASHILCLLKGVPIEKVKQAILDGKSISLCFPEYGIYCSGIVSSLMGAAVGHAYAMSKNNYGIITWHFCGDMAAECGIFHEVTKYAYNHYLPIRFIVEDNGVSVMTDTKKVWNNHDSGYKYYNLIESFKYKNEYPHSGVQEKIRF